MQVTHECTRGLTRAPQLPAFPNAYNNHTDLALAVRLESNESVDAAVEEVRRILGKNRFEERIRRLYAADYMCLWLNLTVRGRFERV